MNKKVLECLIKAGAFDCARRPAAARLPGVAAAAARRARSHPRPRRPAPAGSRSGAVAAVRRRRRRAGRARRRRRRCRRSRPWTETEALAFEKEALGLYMSGHPLQRYAEALAAVGARRLGDLTQSEADCTIGGIVTGLRPLKTKRGDRMAVFMLEDEVAKVEAVVFPEAFAQVRRTGRRRRDAARARQVRARRGNAAGWWSPRSRRSRSVRERAVREVEITLAGTGLGKDAMRRAGRRARAPSRRSPRVVRRRRERRGPHLRVRAATARRIRPSDQFVRDVEARLRRRDRWC